MISILKDIQQNNVEKVKKYLEENPDDIIILDDKSRIRNLLTRSIIFNAFECFELFMKSFDKMREISRVYPIIEAIESTLTDSRSSQYVKSLLEAKTDPNLIDDSGKPLIFIAIAEAKPKCVKLLLDHGAKIETKDLYDNTPLVFSAVRPFSGCTHLLIQAKANINSQNVNGKTALHYFIQDDDYYGVEMMINAKAKLNIKDCELKVTPLDIIEKNLSKYENDSFDKRIKDIILDTHRKTKKRKFKECQSDDCVICLMEIGAKQKDVYVTKCYHIFHKECWKQYQNKDICPICRQPAQ
jgi:ankyrin repeat protein